MWVAAAAGFGGKETNPAAAAATHGLRAGLWFSGLCMVDWWVIGYSGGLVGRLVGWVSDWLAIYRVAHLTD